MRSIRNLTFLLLLIWGCSTPQKFDVLIRNGYVVDGSGSPRVKGDIGINADTIAAVGDLAAASGSLEIDANGLIVAPGFINMLSWATESLIHDGRSQSDIRQGVTLEVMGEGWSMGPLNEALKEEMLKDQQDILFDVEWTTLGEYLEYLEKKGVSTNIASFVGNGTLRQYVMGYENRLPSDEEMATMKNLLREAMEEGAVGLSTSLIYVPSGHAQKEEIIELAKVAAEYDGMYISHVRNEEAGVLDAISELITIAREAGIRSEVYHFKVSGHDNWHLMEKAIQLIDSARKAGLPVTTDMYNYNASSTGLNILLPTWAKEGGHEVTMKMIANPEMRQKMMDETIFHVPPENILLVGFKNENLRHLIGKTLAWVVEDRNITPQEAIVDLIYEDDSRIQVVYFSMSEDNIRKKIALPYMSFCSDAGSYATEGVFLEQSTHPRAYGSFSRLLGRYVRDEGIISIEEAIRKLTSLPAGNLKIKQRGLLQVGHFADVVVFDAAEIRDHATFDKPHQYASGVVHVFVNGQQVINNGEHTGALPGRVVRGPGWKQLN